MFQRLKELILPKPKKILYVKNLSLVEIDELVRKERPDFLDFGDGIRAGVNLIQAIEEHEAEGDGKAEFLPDMDEATLLEWQRNEDLGWKNFKLPWTKKN